MNEEILDWLYNESYSQKNNTNLRIDSGDTSPLNMLVIDEDQQNQTDDQMEQW